MSNRFSEAQSTRTQLERKFSAKSIKRIFLVICIFLAATALFAIFFDPEEKYIYVEQKTQQNGSYFPEIFMSAVDEDAGIRGPHSVTNGVLVRELFGYYGAEARPNYFVPIIPELEEALLADMYAQDALAAYVWRYSDERTFTVVWIPGDLEDRVAEPGPERDSVLEMIESDVYGTVEWGAPGTFAHSYVHKVLGAPEDASVLVIRYGYMPNPNWSDD